MNRLLVIWNIIIRGEGADISRRVSWAKVLTRDEADRIKIDVVFPDLKEWSSYYSGK